MQHATSQPPTASGQQTGEPDADLTEVLRREILLLQPHTRTDARAVLALLHPDFVEFGAFGGVWDITTVTASLGRRDGSRVRTVGSPGVRRGGRGR